MFKMRTIVSSLSTAGSSNSNNHLNSSTSTLLSADTDPLMSASSCSTYAPDTSGNIISHVTLKVESKKEIDSTAASGGAAPGRKNNNSSNNSSGGESSLCNSPSYQRSQNNYSLPPINGLTSSFNKQQQQITSISASHSPARKTLTVNHSSGSSGNSAVASPLSTGGSISASKTTDQRRSNLSTTTTTQSKTTLNSTTVIVRERSVSANNIPVETNGGGGNGVSPPQISETMSAQEMFLPEISFTTQEETANGQDNHLSPSSGGGQYSPSNSTNQQNIRQNGVQTSNSSSYTTLMPLQLTALPPIANVSDKFAGSPLRMFGSSTSSSSSNTNTSLNQVESNPNFTSRQPPNGNIMSANDSGGTSIDSGSVIFVNDTGVGHSSQAGESTYLVGDHQSMNSAFSGIDTGSLMNLNGLDLVNGDGLLGDFQSHDSQLQHIDNFSSLPLQQQLQQHHQTLSELQPPPVHYYQQNPFSHLGPQQHHHQNQPFRLTLGSNLLVSANNGNNNSMNNYAQDPMMMRQLNTSNADGGIHVHVGTSSNNGSNVIMMGNGFDSSLGFMDQFYTGGDSQLFTNENGKDQQQQQTGNEPRVLKPLVPQQLQQQQQQPVTFVTIQGQMPVGAIKITIPGQQQQQHHNSQYPQQLYQTGPGGFLSTAIINSDGRIIVPSNMLFTGPGGQTFLINPASAMPLQQQQTVIVSSQQQQQSMHPEIANEVIVTSSMPLRGLEFLDNGAGDYDDNDLAEESAYEQKPFKVEDDGNKTASNKPKPSTSKTSLTNVINKLTSKAQQAQQQQQVASSTDSAGNQLRSSQAAESSKTTSSNQSHPTTTRTAVKRAPLSNAAPSSSNDQLSILSTGVAGKKVSPTTGGGQRPAPNTANHIPVTANNSEKGHNVSTSALPLLPNPTTKGYIVRPLNSASNAAKGPAGAHRFMTLSKNPLAGANRADGDTTSGSTRKYQPLPILSQNQQQLTEKFLAAGGATRVLTASGVEQILAPVADRNPTNGNIKQQVENGVVPEGESLSSSSSLINCGADGENGSTTSDNDDDDGRRSSSISNPEEDAEMEKVNTRELSQRVSAELKRYSIPQAVFAQRVLCRSQGTLSDLLRNPKPWSKLKSGRETFRRMYRWLQEPEFQRMSSLRLAACKRKEVDNTPYIPSTSKSRTVTEASQSSFASGEDQHPDEDEDYEGGHSEALGVIVGTPAPQDSSSQQASSEQSQLPSTSHPATKHHHSGSKKPRLVFTESQKRTLLAIFKENRRPNKDMQNAVAQSLNLDITTVSNFFMNARRRSQDKWLEDAAKAASTSGGATPTNLVASTKKTAASITTSTSNISSGVAAATVTKEGTPLAAPRGVRRSSSRVSNSATDATTGKTNGIAIPMKIQMQQ